MDAAEDGKEETRDNWNRNGQQYCDYPVDPDPAHFKQGMTPDPHSVSTAHWHRLSYNVLKRHLETQKESGADAAELNQWFMLDLQE